MEEEIFNNRLNFFLLIETVLISGFCVLVVDNKSMPHRELLLRIFLLIGLILSIIWAYVQARQNFVLRIVRKRAVDILPEYAETQIQLDKVRWPIRIRTLLTFVVPAFFIAVWIMFQFLI